MKKTACFVVTVLMMFTVSGFAIAEDITIVGTGSGMTLLKAIGDAFTQKNPDIKIIIPESIDSSGGIKAVGTDKYKIGRVSREIKDTEKEYGLTYVPIAKMPIVFFTNKSVAVKDITPQQVCDIYSGKLTNWKDAGGGDEGIRVIRRQDGDSALMVLIKSLEGFKNITITEKSKTTLTAQETILLAEQKTGTIAFAPYESTLNHNLNILSINGKKVTEPDYLYYSVLALIFKGDNNTGNIRKFIVFVKSPDAREIIMQSGGLPFSSKP